MSRLIFAVNLNANEIDKKYLLFQKEIIDKGSSEGADIATLFGGTLSCIAWFSYGFLLKDVFVYVSFSTYFIFCN